MEMEGRRAFAAGQQELWDALNDPELLKACIPGCERFESAQAGQHALDLELRIGAGTARFNGIVQVADRFEPDRYQVHFEGNGGVAGMGKGVARARLIPLADYAPGHPRCQLHYSVDATLEGNMAMLDPRLVDGAARALTEHFFRRFDEQLRRRFPRATPAELVAEPADMDAQERAGAPTMLLDQAARVRPTAHAVPTPKALGTPTWVWAALAALVVLVGVFIFARLR